MKKKVNSVYSQKLEKLTSRTKIIQAHFFEVYLNVQVRNPAAPLGVDNDQVT